MTVESVSFEEASQLSTSESHEAEQSIRVPRGGVQTFRWRSTWVVNRIDRMSKRSILSCITVASQEAFCLLHQACSVNECVEFQGLLRWTGILLAHIDFWDFDSFSSLPCTVVFTAGMSGVFRLSLTLSS